MAQTIVAQATANGLSGLSVIRVSGEDAFVIADKCFTGKKTISKSKSHKILYGRFTSPTDKNNIIDDVTVSIFKCPHSYTGENVVEFGTHGGSIIPMQIIQYLIEAGCRVAEPGEFTRRAFINGRISLVQAEAIADVIHSISIPSVNISERQLQAGITLKLSNVRSKLLEIASLLELELDFADEDVPLMSNKNILSILSNTMNLCNDLTNSFQASNILRDGFYVAIIGKPNAGKSTLFNALLNQYRAIVSDIPGTTRDYLSEYIYLDNLPIKIIDTAGLRETKNSIEIEGIKLVHNTLKQVNLILLVNDINEYEDNSNDLYNELKRTYENTEILLIQNKIDIYTDFYYNTKYKYSTISQKTKIPTIYISAKEKDGIEKLKKYIIEITQKAITNLNDILLNERQYYKLLEVSKVINNAMILLENNEIAEIISIEIRNAGRLLGELTGETWNEEVLNNIFSKFCIGK